jgi:hypothetical protein
VQSFCSRCSFFQHFSWICKELVKKFFLKKRKRSKKLSVVRGCLGVMTNWLHAWVAVDIYFTHRKTEPPSFLVMTSWVSILFCETPLCTHCVQHSCTVYWQEIVFHKFPPVQAHPTYKYFQKLSKLNMLQWLGCSKSK